MKKIFIGLLTISTFTFAACNNGSNKNVKQDDMKSMKKDTPQLASSPGNEDMKTVAVAYTNVDATAAISIKKIVDNYLQIKNALANDKGNEAAADGKAMEEAIHKLDKSLLTSEQKKMYDTIEESLEEDAEHIGKNGDNIKHQREHFSSMSEGMYELVKAFGGGRALYHDHCPMYNESKGGAMWVSETEEVKNPYFGNEMTTCGSVVEIIK